MNSSIRLQWLCRVVQALVLAGAIGILVAAAWWRLSPDMSQDWASDFRAEQTAPMSERSQWLGLMLTLLPEIVALLALWQLWLLFGEYAHGRTLMPRAQQLLMRLAVIVLAAALLRPLYRGMLSVAATIDNPPGQRVLMLRLGSEDYLSVLLGLVLLAIAVVMREAVNAAQENRSFV
jgi:hypothetical protein